MVGLGGERHDQVEIVVLEIVEHMRLVAAERQPHFLEHDIDERVALAAADTGGGDIDTLRQVVARDRLGHRRTDRIHAAHEQYRAGQFRLQGDVAAGVHAHQPRQ